MPHDNVLIAGGGIGGLALALTLDQIGVPCIAFESVRELMPLAFWRTQVTQHLQNAVGSPASEHDLFADAPTRHDWPSENPELS